MEQLTDTEKQEPLSSSFSNHERIVDLLKKDKAGLTIAYISRLLWISRNTVVVSLALLQGARQINIRRIGMAKVYFLKSESKRLS